MRLARRQRPEATPGAKRVPNACVFVLAAGAPGLMGAAAGRRR